VVNATGVFVDAIRKKDDPDARSLVSPSQGIHIVLDRSFFPSESALLIPRTEDGRVLFAVPWHEHVLLGTTDTPVDDVSTEPRPLDEEIDYLLRYASRYLKRAPTRSDILSSFAGLRPLVGSDDESDTASISRDHVVRISKSGLITVTGGKWTTYRKMGEDAIDEAVRIGALTDRPSPTDDLRLHGWNRPGATPELLDIYGSDAPQVQEILEAEDRGEERLHYRLPFRRGEVIWAARYEMARTVEDVLSRRTRTLLLDARAAIESAPAVADLMAGELGRDEDWKQTQIREFLRLAGEYVPDGTTTEHVTESREELSIRK
jgi:glycerol-3-phosphate dehydrogenase